MDYENLKYMEQWQNLANAIVEAVADDYMRQLADLPSASGYRPLSICECEKFFYSQWFHLLTSVDPDYLVQELRRKAKEWKIIYTAAETEDHKWYVCRMGEEDKPLSRAYTKKRKALLKAAERQGINAKLYLTIRRRDCLE